MGQIAFDDDFKNHMERKYTAIANGSHQKGVIAKIERDQKIHEHTQSIANFLAIQADQLIQDRTNGNKSEASGVRPDLKINTQASYRPQDENRFASTGRNKQYSESQASTKMTARSLANVPGGLPMGNISATNGSVKLKVSQQPSLYSQQANSISSSRRMLKIKGIKESRNEY